VLFHVTWNKEKKKDKFYKYPRKESSGFLNSLINLHLSSLFWYLVCKLQNFLYSLSAASGANSRG